MKRALAPIALASALLSSGCFPVAMLPSEHRLGGGVVGGSMRGSDAEPSAARVGAQFHYRGSIHVLALVPEKLDRFIEYVGPRFLEQMRDVMRAEPDISVEDLKSEVDSIKRGLRADAADELDLNVSED